LSTTKLGKTLKRGSATDCIKQLNETKNNKTTFHIYKIIY
jgi:hypothetical protein